MVYDVVGEGEQAECELLWKWAQVARVTSQQWFRAGYSTRGDGG